jgi:DNA-binding IclR family transcriptional regulator
MGQGKRAGNDGTQSIRRAVEILRQVARYGRSGARLVDVTEALNLQRSTVHRILQCMAAEGLITQKTPGIRYVMGPLAFELGLGVTLREKLREISRPSLQRIASESGDVAFLSIRSGIETVTIDYAEGAFPIKAYTRQIGDRRPIGFGAVGISMLALMPQHEAESLINQGAHALKAFNNETSADALNRLDTAKRRGYALHERPSMQLRAIALAFRNPDGEPFAAFSLCAIASRLKKHRIDEMITLIKSEIAITESALISNASGHNIRRRTN